MSIPKILNPKPLRGKWFGGALIAVLGVALGLAIGACNQDAFEPPDLPVGISKEADCQYLARIKSDDYAYLSTEVRIEAIRALNELGCYE